MAFDLEVQKRDSKGRVVKVQPYRLVIENGVQRFERPTGSGYWYDAAGVLVKEPAQAKQTEAKK